MTVRPSLRSPLSRADKGLLRFLTCGSVDDGKSTLIGRLLYDTKLIFEDQLATLEQDSPQHGTTGEDIDFALLVDGLEAEREQGITIDVAYRFFATAAALLHRRRYARPRAVHPQHGDRRLELPSSPSSWSMRARACWPRPAARYICSLLGIRHVVLAVNKIDLVGFDAGRLRRASSATYAAFAAQLGFRSVVADPDLGALRRQRHGTLRQ